MNTMKTKSVQKSSEKKTPAIVIKVPKFTIEEPYERRLRCFNCRDIINYVSVDEKKDCFDGITRQCCRLTAQLTHLLASIPVVHPVCFFIAHFDIIGT